MVSKAKETTKTFLGYSLAALLIKCFLVESFYEAAGFMEGACLKGDYLLVSKFHYGPRLPKTPLQWPFTHGFIGNTKIKAYYDGFLLPYIRIPGFAAPQRGDVALFNYPLKEAMPDDLKPFSLSRIAGLPGESIEIAAGEIFIDGKASRLPNALPKSIYQMPFPPGNQEQEYVYATDEEAAALNCRPAKTVLPKNEMSERCFPFHPLFKWNKDYFGPLTIPKKGFKLRLDSLSIPLYWDAIIKYEKMEGYRTNGLTITDAKGLLLEEYIFKNDYFFVLGDHRPLAEDSRDWGFLPESHIAGKALMVWWSYDAETGGMRWDRIGARL